jgi:hypothetical protein
MELRSEYSIDATQMHLPQNLIMSHQKDINRNLDRRLLPLLRNMPARTWNRHQIC